MPYLLKYPDINGHRYGFSSIEIDYAGLKIAGFKSINYSSSLDPGELRGNSAVVLGRTRGNFSSDASCEMYRLEFDNLKEKLAAIGLATPGQMGFMEVSFPIIVSYCELSAANATVDTLVGVRIKKVDSSNAQGTDASTIKLDLHVMNILYNGVPAVAQPFPIGI